VSVQGASMHHVMLFVLGTARPLCSGSSMMAISSNTATQ